MKKIAVITAYKSIFRKFKEDHLGNAEYIHIADREDCIGRGFDAMVFLKGHLEVPSDVVAMVKMRLIK